MKRNLAAVLSILLVLAIATSGCRGNVPIKEELTNYGDNSTVYMPVVETGNLGIDRQINKELRSRLEENFKSIRGDNRGTTTEGFTAFQSGDLLSIFQEGYFEKEGKDIGDSYLYTLHINTKNGNFYELDDLFNPGYEEELTGLVANMLDKRLEEYNMSYIPDIKGASFDVYGGELIFIFDPQSVAPKSMGFIDIAISFSGIDHLLNKDGEFYKVIVQE